MWCQFYWKYTATTNPNPVLCGAIQFVCGQFYILYLQISVCDANSTESVQQQPTQTQYCVELYSLFVDSSIYYICRFLYVMTALLKVYSNNQPNPVLCGAIQFVCRQFYKLYLQISVCDANSAENVKQQPTHPSTVWSYTVLCRQFYILYLQISVCDANSTESVQQQPAQPSSVWSYTVSLSTVLYIIFTYICMWCQLYWQCTATTRLTQYIYYGAVSYSLSVDSCIYYIDRFLYVMPTLLKVYSNNQPNPVLCGAIQFVCRQFYILHRKPFMLQVIVTYLLILEKTQQNLNSSLKHFLD